MLPKPYKYKKKRRGEFDSPKNRLKYSSEGEQLTGIVQNQTASAYEERFAKALSKKKLNYHFQVVLPTNYQIPGQLNTIDFLVVVGVEYPIEVDGDWVHKSGAQRGRDAQRDAIIDAQMMPQGWMPIQRVPGHKLETQDDADALVGGMF